MTDVHRPEDQGNEPAFPWPLDTPPCGLTKRELFAAMAMQGALSGEPGPHLRFDELARYSVTHADALLKELAK